MIKTTYFLSILKYLLLLIFMLSIGACSNSKSNTTEQSNAIPVSEKSQNLEDTLNAASSIPEYNFDLEYIMGKFDPTKHNDFLEIESKYASRQGMYLRKEVYEAFQKMHEAAHSEGIQLIIKSATRNFYRQKQIWEGKWTGQRKIENGKDASKTYPEPVKRATKILEYSSMPGTSRHHWGTDIDLNNFTNEYFESGKGLKEYEWLIANAATFGFCQPYTEKGADRPYGYNGEKWHWTYNPTALELTEQAKRELKAEMIQGFKGAETAVEISVVEKYVLGINKECK